MNNRYLVTGVSRSGTSNVARIMHEELGIKMGNEFEPNDEVNPKGYYEDVKFKKIIKGLMQGKLYFNEWVAVMQKYINEREDEGVPWGMKSPDVWLVLGFFLGTMRGLRIVYCVRDREMVARSIVKNWGKYGWTEEMAHAAWFQRTTIAQGVLQYYPDLVEINYGIEHLADDIIINKITGKWGTL